MSKLKVTGVASVEDLGFSRTLEGLFFKAILDLFTLLEGDKSGKSRLCIGVIGYTSFILHFDRVRSKNSLSRCGLCSRDNNGKHIDLDKRPKDLAAGLRLDLPFRRLGLEGVEKTMED